MKALALLVMLSGFLLNSAHAELGGNPKALNQHPVGENTAWEYALDAQGKMWLAYYGSDNLLYVRRPDGVELTIGAQNRDRAMSGLALDASQDSLALMWRDKFPEKTLNFIPHLAATGPLPAPQTVGGDSQPLIRMEIAERGNDAYLLWLGEKPDRQTKQRYHVYFRHMKDGGQTMSEVAQVMPGIYPMWIVDQDDIAVFSWVRTPEKKVIAMRRFDRASGQFEPMVEIAPTPDQIPPIYRSFASAGRWLVMWLAQHGDGKDFLLEGAYSEDKGKTWKRFAFESLKGLDLSYLATATDGKGHIALAFSGTRRLRDDNPDAKNDVYFTVSADNGTTWSEPRTLRTGEQQLTHARFPTLSFGAQPGVLVMAWEDWRDIRPNVYVTHSTDYGVTWQTAVPLDLPGRVNLGMDFKIKQALIRHGDAYHLIVKRFIGDNLGQPELVHYSLTLDDLKQQKSLLPEETAQLEKARLNDERLRQRVNEYWQAMQREDYAISYAMHDPFFQAQVDRQAYFQKMGTIKYTTLRIDAVERIGKIAKVKLTVEAFVPEFKTPSGKTYSKPKAEYPMIETWLFISGDWYREYYEESAERRFTQY